MTNAFLFRLGKEDKKNRKIVTAFVKKEVGVAISFRQILSSLLSTAAEQAKNFESRS